MNLEKWISEHDDGELWSVLADIGNVLGSRTRKLSIDNDFWYEIAKSINDEIDKRLLRDSEN